MNRLSIDQIKEKAPMAFATEAAPTTSAKYSFLPSSRIMEDMEKLGWYVGEAKSMKAGGKNPLRATHGKHILQFFNPDVVIKNEGGVEAYPQIVVTNDSAGWGKIKIDAGLFRLVCENGLVIKSQDMGSLHLRHMGYTFEDLQTLVNQFVEGLQAVTTKLNTFQQKIMTIEEQRAFAAKALQIRMGEEKIATSEEINQMLQVRREADQGDNLWVVFNRVQEAIIRGGNSYIDAKGKLRTARPIKNMIQDMKINQGIWEVAEEYVA